MSTLKKTPDPVSKVENFQILKNDAGRGSSAKRLSVPGYPAHFSDGLMRYSVLVRILCSRGKQEIFGSQYEVLMGVFWL